MKLIQHWSPAAKITITYFIFGALWILLSDLALMYVFKDKQIVIHLQTFKGWFYILLTSGLLFWLLNQQIKKLLDTESRWRFALEGSGDGVWDWDLTSNSVWFSKQWKKALGFRDEEIGTSLEEWSSRVHPDDLQDVLANLKSHIEGEDSCYTQEYRMLNKDGGYKWVLDRGRVIYRNAHGKALRMVGTNTDITESKLSEDNLKLAAKVFTHAREGIMITDSKSIIVDVNQTFTEITGYHRNEAIGHPPSILKSGKQSAEFYSLMWQTIHSTGHWSGELWNRRKDGSIYVEMLTISEVRDANNKVMNYVALFSDITHRIEYQNQLEKLANYDVLTNLPNRVLLSDRLRQSMLQAKRHDKSLAVIFIDLDGFKEVNDRYGHDFGDQLLIEISKFMGETLREEDTLARLGGDEFVAIITDLEKHEDAEPILERILDAACSSILIDGRYVKVAASIGVSFYPEDNVDADILLRHADQAMYSAKESGGNCYHFFDTIEADSLKELREKIFEIQSAIEQRKFVLHYQPQINMRTGQVIGLEALVRWQHPTLGLLYPNAFLPLIENNPLIIALGELVIEMVLTQIAQWQNANVTTPETIGINISALQLEKPNFAERLATLLTANPEVNPNQIELEVLETSALEDVEKVSSTINDCLALGVKFAIDDFGTGYSSLTYLRNLPVGTIKLDQSFVRDMLKDNDDLSIVKGVIALCESFNRSVIAEGVETIAHGSALLELGCELAQGYAIAKPMPADGIPSWLSNWHQGEATNLLPWLNK